MAKSIRHTGIVVRDMNKALQFYKDLLGFTILKDALETGPFIEHLLGIPHIKVRTVKMTLGQGGLLELLDFQDKRIPRQDKQLTHEGLTHFALTVKDLDHLYQHLKKAGVSFIAEPKVSPDGGAKVAFCSDFEGNFLELVQELN